MLGRRRAFLAMPSGRVVFIVMRMSQPAKRGPHGSRSRPIPALFATSPNRSQHPHQLKSFDSIHFSPIEEVVGTPAFRGASCSLAMRRTRRRLTWPKARPWRWRMRWCWPRYWQRTARRGGAVTFRERRMLASGGCEQTHRRDRIRTLPTHFAISRSVCRACPLSSRLSTVAGGAVTRSPDSSVGQDGNATINPSISIKYVCDFVLYLNVSFAVLRAQHAS